jgi:hypothetical protein
MTKSDNRRRTQSSSSAPSAHRTRLHIAPHSTVVSRRTSSRCRDRSCVGPPRRARPVSLQAPSASTQRVPMIHLERCPVHRSWFSPAWGAPCGADRHKIGPYTARGLRRWRTCFEAGCVGRVLSPEGAENKLRTLRPRPGSVKMGCCDPTAFSNRRHVTTARSSRRPSLRGPCPASFR